MTAANKTTPAPKSDELLNTLRFVMAAFLIAGVMGGSGAVVAYGLENYLLGAVMAACALAVLVIVAPFAERLRVELSQ